MFMRWQSDRVYLLSVCLQVKDAMIFPLCFSRVMILCICSFHGFEHRSFSCAMPCTCKPGGAICRWCRRERQAARRGADAEHSLRSDVRGITSQPPCPAVNNAAPLAPPPASAPPPAPTPAGSSHCGAPLRLDEEMEDDFEPSEKRVINVGGGQASVEKAESFKW